MEVFRGSIEGGQGGVVVGVHLARITRIIIGISILPLEPPILRPEVNPKLAQNHPSHSSEEALDGERGVGYPHLTSRP